MIPFMIRSIWFKDEEGHRAAQFTFRLWRCELTVDFTLIKKGTELARSGIDETMVIPDDRHGDFQVGR